ILKMLVDAGKPTVAVLTKMAPGDADEFVTLFNAQVATALPHRERLAAVETAPAPPPARRMLLWTDEYPYVERFRAAVRRAAAGCTEGEARRRAVDFLRRRLPALVDPLRRDLAEWRSWMELIRSHANDAVLGYEREYLAKMGDAEFHEAAERVLAAITPGGQMGAAWRAFEMVRMPYRAAMAWLRRTSAFPMEPVDEELVLARQRRSLMESLYVAATARKNRRRFWKDLHLSLQQEANAVVEPMYRQVRDRQRRELRQRLDSVSQSATDALWRRPVLTTVLRGGRVGVDVAATLTLLYVAYASGYWLMTLLAAPIAYGLVDQAVRAGARRYVHRGRAAFVLQQKENIRELIQTAYIDPLLSLPRASQGRLYRMAQLEEQLPADLAAVAVPLARVAEEEVPAS
ncbi:MAG: hypothetical protein ACRC1K_07985, partial [Planctomycetia bacterium]